MLAVQCLPSHFYVVSSKIGKLALEPIGFGEEELYAWQYDYDPEFLDTMAGILKLNQIDRDGFAMV